MAGRCLLVLLVLVGLVSACLAANPVKMRPYSGIGVVLLRGPVADQELQQQIPLYEEPGLFRVGTVDFAKLSGNEWIFGSQARFTPLIVMSRKGHWLQVCYDDAGREAWINLPGRDSFQTWEAFLKSRMSRMLPGLRKQYYQLYLQPGKNPVMSLVSTQSFKVLKLEHGWAMVLAEQKTIGWLRWLDEDGRLTIGLD